MDAAAAAGAWVDAWSRAWPVGDVELVATLYDEACVFYSAPFRERQAPRDYVTWAFGDQASAECRFGEPIVAGDRAAVDWWAVMTGRDGSQESIAGTSLLRFGADGLVLEQRDVWELKPGRHPLRDWPPESRG